MPIPLWLLGVPISVIILLMLFGLAGHTQAGTGVADFLLCLYANATFRSRLELRRSCRSWATQ